MVKIGSEFAKKVKQILCDSQDDQSFLYYAMLQELVGAYRRGHEDVLKGAVVLSEVEEYARVNIASLTDEHTGLWESGYIDALHDLVEYLKEAGK